MRLRVPEELRAALESPFFTDSPDGIAVVAEDGTIVAANSRLAEVLGYDTTELIGAAIEMLVPGPLRQVHVAHRDGFVTSPHRRPMGTGLRLEALHSDGSAIPVDIALSPMRFGSHDYTIAALRDATERVKAEIALSEADEWRAIIDDRQRIARDLHDTVIQDIFAAGMGLQAVQRKIPEPQVRDQLGDTVNHLDRVITRLRKVIFNLTQGDEAEPFESAARRVIAATIADTAIETDLTVRGAGRPLPARTQEHVLATLQEALSNVLRHSEATAVEIHIGIADEMCQLCVLDNGIGMPDAAATRPGFGLTNMMNRAQVLGGSCEITPGPDGGTMVEWKVPL